MNMVTDKSVGVLYLIQVGSVQALYRHPVKSFQGERLDESLVETYGLRGDRSHAFINHDRFGRHLSAKRIPYLLSYQAEFTESVEDNDFPGIQITSPQGELFKWDEAILKHMTDRFGLNISMETYPMNHHGQTAVDEANLLITTDASLAALADLLGEPVDMRRFRPNIVLRLDSGKPFEEVDWIGRTLRIADVELEVYKQCQRCIMIGVDPKNANVDLSILRDVSQQLDAFFGVYAKVVQTGSIQIDDPVWDRGMGPPSHSSS